MEVYNENGRITPLEIIEYKKNIINICDIKHIQTIQNPLKFIHITKTAGTSIENAGEKNGIEWGRFHKECNNGGQFWHKRFSLYNSEIVDKYDWFMVVRNPYDRILSELYCNYTGLGNNKKNISCHTNTEINNYLIKKINGRSVDGNHYTEQYKYLHKNKKIFVIKFENINQEFNTLMRHYSLGYLKLEKSNVRKTSEIAFNVSCFSDKLIQLINEVYEKDFVLFNYDKLYRHTV
jgi:hypothetical protein